MTPPTEFSSHNGEWCDECGDENELLYETDDGRLICERCKYGD